MIPLQNPYKDWRFVFFMGLFGFGKKDKVLDLSENYRRQQQRAKEMKEEAKIESKGEESSGFSFLSGLASGSPNSSDSSSSSDNYSSASSDFSQEDTRKKLAKRLADMTNKLEEISTQLYHLQQRVELLERKTGVKSGM